ncbi:MAG: aminoglycoside phosphotransferase family protein [Alphaproteobacteria bacterium]|nr:aminoglycoside phosphotransferase family protein [Alphaproteobacteria bacterium]
MPDLAALARALAAVPGLASLRKADLELLPTKGIAHDHVRLAGRGLIARLPRPGQLAIPPERYIPYQEASFRRAGPSGHTPRLVAAIAPSPALPSGALVIQEIAGRAPRIPAELALIAECLARIHGLPVPPPDRRAPLADHADAVAGTLAVIERQVLSLDPAGVAGAARAAIEDELAWARGFARASAGAEQPVALVASDTHPGNYLVDGSGRAILVDVEKMLYGSPAIDLAHATLYTSTTWDIDTGVALDPADVAGFYRDYLARIDPALARRLGPWLAPMRRLTWLRTTTWACRFKAEILGRGAAGDPGSPYVRHVSARIADFLDPATIARIRHEWLDDATPQPG